MQITKEVLEAYLEFPDRSGFVPVNVEDGKVLFWVVSGDDSALQKAQFMSVSLGLDCEIKLKAREAVLEAMERLLTSVDEAEEEPFEEDYDLEEEDIVGTSYTDAPIVKLVNQFIVKAVSKKASDIHIEPFGNRMAVRFRINGKLEDYKFYGRKLLDPVIARIKVMAGLDVAESRKPQDGVIRVSVGAKSIDIRVSVVPSISGEKAVLRMLYSYGGLLDLKDTGMSEEEQDLLLRKALYPNGIILVTGPTGSGKTTTLYALLRTIATRDKHVITIEDPVEYKLEGVTQVQVNPHVGLTFSSALKYFLRQDPDIILVGEIRDVETAQTAISASLTGHLVLSTLHTNDAATTITRLIDMGIEPFLLASSLLLVMGQRLVRKVCPHCAQEVSLSGELADLLGSYARDVKTYLKGEGCEACGNTGYIGRVGIFELLEVDDDIQRLIIKRADSTTIKRAAVQKGMRTMFEDGIDKVKRGITTPEEVLLATRL